MHRNGLFCCASLCGMALWCAAWYVPLLATGAAIKAAGKVIGGGK